MKTRGFNNLVRDEIRSRLELAKSGRVSCKRMDSICNHVITKKQKRMIRKYADIAIVIHDVRYNDIVGTSVFIGVFTGVIMPMLVGLLKSAVIGAMSSAIKEKTVDPTLNRLISKGKQLIASKGKDDTYTEAIIGGIKKDMDLLINTLGKEGGFIKQKIIGQYSKIRNIT